MAGAGFLAARPTFEPARSTPQASDASATLGLSAVVNLTFTPAPCYCSDGALVI